MDRELFFWGGVCDCACITSYQVGGGPGGTHAKFPFHHIRKIQLLWYQIISYNFSHKISRFL